MSNENSLDLDGVAEERRRRSVTTVAETDDARTSAPKPTGVGRQYIPSDALHLDDGPESSPRGLLRSWAEKFGFSRGPSLPRSHAAVDLLVMMSCFAAVHLTYLGSLDLTHERTVSLLGSVLFSMMFLSAGGMYSKKQMRSLGGELTTLLICWICTFAAVGLLAFLTKIAEDVSRVWVTTSMILSLILLAGLRMAGCVRLAPGARTRIRNVIVCGNASGIRSTMHGLYKFSNSRIRVARVFEFPTLQPGIAPYTSSFRTSASQMVKFVEEQRRKGDAIAQVWVALPVEQAPVVEELSKTLIDSSVDICVVPDPYTERLLKGETTTFGDTSVVNISEISLPPAADRFKRVFDVVLASIALLVLCVPMLVIALLIRTETPGPALFRQRRYGADGREIEVLKFRSMCVHSDSRARQATRDDVRVTRIGRVLRSTSLDELPQLINVLRGTMSLVGPRPHAVAHNEIWRSQISGYMLRHKVRPGITGLAQVNGWRGETDTAFKMQQRVKFDLEYIQNWSPWLDVKILMATVLRGFVNKNAY